MASNGKDVLNQFEIKKKQEDMMRANKMKQRSTVDEEAVKAAHFRNKITEKQDEYVQSSRQAIFGPSQVWREFFELLFGIRDVIAIEAGLKKVDGTPSTPPKTRQELMGNYAPQKT